MKEKFAITFSVFQFTKFIDMSMPHVPYVLPNSCFNKYLFSKLFLDTVSSMRNQIYVCMLLLTKPAVNGDEATDM